MSLIRNGQRIARVVGVTLIEVNEKKSYHVRGMRFRGMQITKRLFDDLNWYAADVDTMQTVVSDNRIVRSKTLYIPEYNNGGVLERLDQYLYKKGGLVWN